ncbi:MAG: hypothetical protein U1E28_21895 [Beijerinckiaceae bacterium]
MTDGPSGKFETAVGLRGQAQWLKAIARDAALTAEKSRFVGHAAMLLALVYADNESGLVWVGKDTLARVVQGDVKSVWRSITAMLRHGYLSDTGARKGRAHVFEMRIPIRAPMPEVVVNNSDTDARLEDGNRAPVFPKSGAGVHEIGRRCPAYIDEPTLEPTSYPKGVSFEKFAFRWRFEDPTDIPGPAQKVFDSLSEIDRANAYAGVEPYFTHCRVNERKVCHARRYLQERRWERFRKSDDVDLADLVWIEAGTPEAAAWNRYKREVEGIRKGLLMQEMARPNGSRAVGRYMPSKWPPDYAPPGSMRELNEIHAGKRQ